VQCAAVAIRSPAEESTATAEHNFVPGVPSGFCQTSAPACGVPANCSPAAGHEGLWPVSTKAGADAVRACGWAETAPGPAGSPEIVAKAAPKAVIGAKTWANSSGSKFTRD
jgi:hypothetical protein